MSKKQEELKQELQEKGKEQAGMVVNNPFIDGLVQVLREKEEHGLTFPADYSPMNALTGAYLVLKDMTDKTGRPLLDVCTKASISNALMSMATQGLDPQKKQCYFIQYKDKLQLHVSYFGNMLLARRCGATHFDSQVIYEKDTFKYEIRDGRKVVLEHKQDFKNIDPAKIVGAYCIVTFGDGSKYAEIMNINEIKQSWKQGFGYKEGSGTHHNFKERMARKTVISRACRSIFQTYGDLINIDDRELDQQEEYSVDEVIVENVQHEIDTQANQIEFDEFVELSEEDATVLDADEEEAFR